MRPIVQIPPQPQRPLQHATEPGAVASTSGQASLLTSQGAIEPLQMGGIYLSTNLQTPNAAFDILEPPKQGIGGDVEQMALGISKFFDYANQQSRWWLEGGLAFSTPAFLASSSMLDLAKDLQNGRWIGQMLVHQQ